jgi:regulator of sigma E protease
MTTSIFAFIIVLGILIFFHELGHFLVARLFGVGVEKFSLGFGPRLVGKTVGITDYRISAIPLGGYVKMVGEEPDAEIDPADIPLSFTHKSVFKRILIVAAGPFFNLVLAVLIFFGFYLMSGIEDVTPVIRNIEADSPAAAAGLKRGDRILSIDGDAVESWYDIGRAVEGSEGQLLRMRISREGAAMTVSVRSELRTGEDLFGDPVTYYGIGIYGFPPLEAVVGNVSSGMPAERAGLKKGDKILAIDGRKVEDWSDMRDVIAASGGKALQLRVLRDDTTFDTSITPALREVKNALGEAEERYLIGISTAGTVLPDEERLTKRLGLFAAFRESLERTWFVAEISVIGIVKMIRGSISSDNLGGPIMIAQMAGEQAKEGIGKLIQFVAFISINLAIINFLPIPVLDGGHLAFFAVEAVRRRPVSLRVREIAQQAGMFILLLLMVFVFYNDIMRYFVKT